ncbi:hypothetical protein [Halorussus litoreus]|uniref:hypothetical protein n=1 Tax=Halorussus litoreus TaxID=1710536 RepID=UPI000E27BE66|nr:hypothetical protein [Halorussus litoreus]
MTRKRKLLVTATAVLVLSASIVVGLPLLESEIGHAETAATASEGFAYPAKFVCGSIAGPNEGVDAHLRPAAEEPPVKPGNYATTINLVNPTNEELRISVQGSIAVGGGFAGEVSNPTELVLEPRQSTKLSCQDIVGLFGDEVAGSQFLDGFVTIRTERRIGVSGVYSAKTVEQRETGAGAGVSVDVVTVDPLSTNSTE